MRQNYNPRANISAVIMRYKRNKTIGLRMLRKLHAVIVRRNSIKINDLHAKAEYLTVNTAHNVNKRKVFGAELQLLGDTENAGKSWTRCGPLLVFYGQNASLL